jgi:predicted transcriptional regulator of viral defense system
MLYDYIVNNYEKDEPIFLSELPGNSKDYIRQEMKQLADEGKIERLYNGVYFLAYTTILGTKGKVSVEKYVKKKFLFFNGEVSGYITGIQLANLYGFTTQNPSCIEVCTNEATTKQRKMDIDGRTLVIYKPMTKITEENCIALQFLDFMTSIDKYSDLTGDDLRKKLTEFVSALEVDFGKVKQYISLFPDRVYRNIYQGGLMGELV